MVKKIFVMVSFFFLVSISLFAGENRLLMVPRETYIGDETEIRYSLSFPEKQLLMASSTTASKSLLSGSSRK